MVNQTPLFDDVCMDLESIFNAAPQTETELNEKSATLLIAALFQMYSHAPLFASFRSRVKSFPDKHQLPIPAAEFASAGFYHSGESDVTFCPACSVTLHDWQESDLPEEGHRLHATPSPNEIDDDSAPVLPCLYLATHRLLTSELPLARKGIIPTGSNRSVCAFQGLVSRRSHHNTYSSISDRLWAIDDAFAAAKPEAPTDIKPLGWPINNARSLGHSDSVIALALWRIQAESCTSPFTSPPEDAITLDPQATTDLLRVILRIQESFIPLTSPATTSASTLFKPVLLDSGLSDDGSSSSTESDDSAAACSSPEDRETADLVNRGRSTRPVRISSRSISPVSEDGDDPDWDTKVDLPKFTDCLAWLSGKFPRNN